MEFSVGTKVTYIPYENSSKESYKRGIIKNIEENIVFVVFNCNNLWGSYMNYTAQGCNPDNLKLGWL